jgi:hypothetical protein
MSGIWNAATSEEYRARIKSDTLADCEFIDHRVFFVMRQAILLFHRIWLPLCSYQIAFLAQAVMSESSHEMKKI